MARCALTRGAGNALQCCRIAGHPTTDGVTEHNGCCLHGVHMGPLPDVHQYMVRASAYPLRCTTGAALDGG